MKAGTDHEGNFMRRYKFGIRCPKCGEKLFSWRRHDLQECSCGHCFIDGGFDYNHIGWESDDKYHDVHRVWGSVPVKLENTSYKLSFGWNRKNIKRFKFMEINNE